VSTTDPDARVMKMGDGGFRPACNIEFATDVDSRVMVGVAVTNIPQGSQVRMWSEPCLPTLQMVWRPCDRRRSRVELTPLVLARRVNP
jgi:hypothetical protein